MRTLRATGESANTRPRLQREVLQYLEFLVLASHVPLRLRKHGLASGEAIANCAELELLLSTPVWNISIPLPQTLIAPSYTIATAFEAAEKPQAAGLLYTTRRRFVYGALQALLPVLLKARNWSVTTARCALYPFNPALQLSHVFWTHIPRLSSTLKFPVDWFTLPYFPLSDSQAGIASTEMSHWESTPVRHHVCLDCVFTARDTAVSMVQTASRTCQKGAWYLLATCASLCGGPMPSKSTAQPKHAPYTAPPVTLSFGGLYSPPAPLSMLENRYLPSCLFDRGRHGPPGRHDIIAWTGGRVQRPLPTIQVSQHFLNSRLKQFAAFCQLSLWQLGWSCSALRLTAF